MIPTASQNIFDYATSELSQDAFISLLIAWFDSPDENLRNISTDFISSLYRKYHELDMKIEIKSVEIKQQHFKIDVYFEITDINGKVIPFIIEDKTWTEPHSNQLKEYVRQIVSKKKYHEKDIVKIFFKTGHITEKDKAETDQAGYIRLDTLWIYNFLTKHESNNIIYNYYKDYLTKTFYKKLYNDNGIQKELKELKDWTYDDLKEGYVQYALIEKIKHLALGITEPIERYIRFTRNGKRWDTWWSIKGHTNKYSIFTKVTKLKEGHCIRLLDYSSSLEGKEARMTKHREIVSEILNSERYPNIKITAVLGDKVKESAIAIMNLEKINSLEDAATEFSKFLKDFFVMKRS